MHQMFILCFTVLFITIWYKCLFSPDSLIVSNQSSSSHRKCGQRPPSNPLEVTSSGNIMLINLITDSHVQRPGFQAKYMAIPMSKGN